MPEYSEREIVERIEGIFADTLSITPPPPELDIIEAALLDSLGLVTLLFEVEQELGVQMPLETLEVDDFRSIGRIAQVIVRLQGGDPGEEGMEEAPPRGAGDGSRSAEAEQRAGT
jgi:acyl carrier protein